MDDTSDVRGMALPLEEEADLEPLLARIGTARCVLLGEASHGTHEYYAWRAALTRRLVAEHGFSFVAVEGDWPDCWQVNRYVRLARDTPRDPRQVLESYRRWPSWMWANEETARLCAWLRDHNADLPADRRAGFYGLDVYSLWESLRAVLGYVATYEPAHVETAVAALGCFEPYGEDPRAYARHARLVPNRCTDEVLAVLTRVRQPVGRGDSTDPAERFSARQNAEVAAGAERYYRAMLAGGAESWNARDTHMADTLDRLLDFHGTDARAVVWAHNSHVGDARGNGMAEAGMTSLGRLVRQRYGPAEVVSVGFTSAYGEVIAAPQWGAPMELMTLAPPRAGSLEAMLSHTELARALFVFADDPAEHWLTTPRDHRNVGVVYDPTRQRGYLPARLADCYDALCWFTKTSALQPLHFRSTRRVA